MTHSVLPIQKNVWTSSIYSYKMEWCCSLVMGNGTGHMCYLQVCIFLIFFSFQKFNQKKLNFFFLFSYPVIYFTHSCNWNSLFLIYNFWKEKKQFFFIFLFFLKKTNKTDHPSLKNVFNAKHRKQMKTLHAHQHLVHVVTHSTNTALKNGSEQIQHAHFVMHHGVHLHTIKFSVKESKQIKSNNFCFQTVEFK